MGREFFIPAKTLIGVKLLRGEYFANSFILAYSIGGLESFAQEHATDAAERVEVTSSLMMVGVAIVSPTDSST